MIDLRSLSRLLRISEEKRPRIRAGICRIHFKSRPDFQMFAHLINRARTLPTMKRVPLQSELVSLVLLARTSSLGISLGRSGKRIAKAVTYCNCWLLTCTSLMLIGFSNQVLASEHFDSIEEVIVTAMRREQGVYDVPAALSVFSGDVIEDQGIVDLVDIGKFVPNLNVTTFAAGHTSSANPFIRGIGLQDHLITTDPGVSVYLDGVYLGRQVAQHWILKNIDRVEVLRGPQGTLYGRNSIGGAINIITFEPGTVLERTFAARVGTRGRLDSTLHMDTNVSDVAALTFSAGVRTRGGVGDFFNLPDVGIDVGEMREFSGRLAFAWDVNPSVSMMVAVDANDGNNGLGPYTTHIDEIPFGAVYTSGYRNSNVSIDPYDNNTGQRNQARTANAAQGLAITLEWHPWDEISTKIIASQRETSYRAGLDDDSLFDDFLSFPEKGYADQTSIEGQVSGILNGVDFVAGFLAFEETGENTQDPTVFLGFRGRFELNQHVDSRAVFVNIGRSITERLRLSVGLRNTEDRKKASTDVGTGLVSRERTWSELNWDVTTRFRFHGRMSAYATVQNGYQSGQFPARPYCLFADSNCFIASDNITALNYEVGVKGQPHHSVELSAAMFRTEYFDLPYQVSTTAGEGFNTVNLIVDQMTYGFEWESRLRVTPSISVHLSVGRLDVDVEQVGGIKPVAPLTPELTVALSPVLERELASGGRFKARLDYSWRDEMWGEPSSDAGRLTRIGARDLINVHLGYEPPSANWQISVYGRNVTDERYDNARLNTGDYLLRILSNDVSEFGLQLDKTF